MSAFPYPIRFFNCHSATMSKEDLVLSQMKKSARLNGWIGAVTGETGIPGLRLDFNCGLRLQLPAGDWHVRISDWDTETLFLDETASETILVSLENYYIHWQVEVYNHGTLVFAHLFDPEEQSVCFAAMDDCALGDALSFLPYIGAFREKYRSRITCHLPLFLQGIARRCYPDLAFAERIPEDSYATYFLNTGLDHFISLPLDGHHVPLHHIGMLTLGLSHPAPMPRPEPGPRAIPEPYVCIGVQASTTAKGWHYPDGWNILCRHLKELGYRVLCIDRDRQCQDFGPLVSLPEEAEDFTGNHPLEARADLLAHAEFFVGLSSGLAWLANLVRCPVVLIGGFSYYWHEFPEAYRVYNRFSCHGCVNDDRVDYFSNFCPRHPQGSPSRLECSRSISPRQVIRAVQELLDDRAKKRYPFC